MPLYWHRLLKDIRDLTTEQVGAYVLLLGYQWEEGGIPADAARIAAIAKISVSKTSAAMAAFGRRFQPHPTLQKTLANPFMERVREEQRLKFEKASRAGKIGAAARYGSPNAGSNRKGNRTANDASNRIADDGSNRTADATPVASADIENRDHHLTSFGDDAHAREGEKSLIEQADALSDFLLETGIEFGVIGEHRREDPLAWHHRNREAASNLIRYHGPEECRLRGRAMLAAMAERRLYNSGGQYPAVLLEKLWEHDAVASATTRPQNTGPSFDEMMGVA